MLRALLLTTAVGGLAVAAPVPKTPPAPAPKASANLTLGTATSDGTRMRITYEVTGVSVVDPSAIPQAARPTTRTLNVLLSGVKVTTADGTELTGDDLTKKLGDGGAVARSVTAIDPEWKKLFADDVLFIEPNGRVNNPLPPGGGLVRPLPAPIRPGRGVAVPPVIEEPPVEKKEEKK